MLLNILLMVGGHFLKTKFTQSFFLFFVLIYIIPNTTYAQASALHGIAQVQQMKKDRLIQSFIDGNENWQESCQLPVIERNQRVIEAMAQKYNIPADAARYILCYEDLDHRPKDWIQDRWARKRLLPLGLMNFLPEETRSYGLKASILSWDEHDYETKKQRSERIAKEDLAFFIDILAEFRKAECEKRLPDNPDRNGEDYWFFATIGIPQFGIFTTLEMVLDGHVHNPYLVNRFKDGSGQWNLNNVAQILASDENAAVEILFARMRQASDVYMKVLNKDIRYSYSTLLQLHRMGYFTYHAWQRYDALKHTPLANDVIDCSTEIEDFSSR